MKNKFLVMIIHHNDGKVEVSKVNEVVTEEKNKRVLKPVDKRAYKKRLNFVEKFYSK